MEKITVYKISDDYNIYIFVDYVKLTKMFDCVYTVCNKMYVWKR